jgi:hypothetical protein
MAMSFTLPAYRAPDFTALGLEDAPEVQLVPVERDGVAPAGYHATTMFPEYFRLNGRWVLAEESRMDCVAVCRAGAVSIVEFRGLKRGDMVAVGRTEDGGEGIYVHTAGFEEKGDGDGESFSFRQGRSRETAYSMDYDSIYELLRHERDHGNIVWVLGPACSFDADARSAFAALVREGFVDGLLAGNALATHDLEAGYLGTALGQDIYTQRSVPNGHYHTHRHHQRRRSLGSIPAFVESGAVKDGILLSASGAGSPLCWWARCGTTGLCPRFTATSTRDRTPCAPWCARPPPSSAWLPPSTPWPPAT